jgi:hypothetical protein
MNPEEAAHGEGFQSPSLGIFEFTQDDLRANQRGLITARQRAWLQGLAGGIERFSWSSATLALGFVLLGTCLILGLYLQNEGSRAALFSSPLNVLLLGAAAAVGTAAIAFSVFMARRQAQSIARAALQRVEGMVRLEQDFAPNSAITSYRVFIGNHRFSFGDDMSSIFHEGGKYRVFFCKSGVYQLILSLEQLTG